jgi:hypothetical protein
MRKVSDSGARIVYRRGGARSAWWLVLAMPAGMIILYLLGSRDVMPYVGLAFAGAVMFLVASTDEHVAIDTHSHAIESFETFFGRPTRTETIPFSQITRVAVMPNYSRASGKRRLERDGFALGLDWTTAAGEGGIRLDTFYEDAEVMAEAEKLARILGTRVERIRV